MNQVVVRVRGLMLERFLERALAEGALLAAVRREGAREMLLTMRDADARIVLALAQRFSMQAEVLAERGAPRLKRWLRARAGVLAGVALGCALLMMFASRVWVIEVVVTGPADGASVAGFADEEQDGAREAALRRALAALGAREGMSARALDEAHLAVRLQAQMPGLTYVGIRLQGVRLKVEVAFEESPPQVFDLEAARDLVAARDGIIVRVDALAGKANVQPGDVVRAGQVLILGVERAAGQEMRAVRALGEVVARIWLRGEAAMATERTAQARTGAARVSSELRMPGWFMPLVAAEDFARQQVEVERLPVGGLFLPVHIVRTWRFEVQDVRVSEDPARLQALLADKALALASAQLPANAQAVDQWISYEEQDGVLTAIAVIEALCDIAAQRGTFS